MDETPYVKVTIEGKRTRFATNIDASDTATLKAAIEALEWTKQRLIDRILTVLSLTIERMHGKTTRKD
jgi:hypothetical protein